jgi:hypothetical protein
MTISRHIAIFFIAGCAICTGATAQKTVYRCGSSYSQVPCDGAVTVNAEDARTKTDKADADKATKRDLKQATEMEKARIKEEKEALAQGKSGAMANAKTSLKTPAQDKVHADQEAEVKKKPKHKKKEPEFFTAKAAPDKKQ